MDPHREGRSRLPLIAATAAVAVVAGMVSVSSAGAAPASSKLAAGITTSKHSLKRAAGHSTGTPRALQRGGGTLPAGVPGHGRYAFLLKLTARSTHTALVQARSAGTEAQARSAAHAQLSAVTAAQNRVISALPSGSKVLYRMHAVLAGVAVSTDVKNFRALTRMSGVSAVYPIAPKSLSNSYAVPLQRAPEAWQAHGDLGANSTVAIIDTGIDYTHADFGGVGTVQEYQDSKAQLGEPVSPGEFPGQKVIGGYDLVGDDYNADRTSAAFNPVPSPDPWPLDCNSHGTHVAGTVAGYGENADGSTYSGAYNESTPFGDMRIGPGMAPEAKLYAYRVFGCKGSTDVVSEAIDMAADPNGDGDTSDHVDVINMSLGSDFGSPQDGDSVATNAAAELGINMSVASGNGGDLYDIGGSPGNAERAIAVAASQDAYSQVDSLNVSAPESIAGSYAAERSILYDWADKPDLAGDVYVLTDPNNLTACRALTGADAVGVVGKVAVVPQWNDAAPECGSITRTTNLSNAHATGFILASNSESFSAGINGSATIPGVLVAKSGGDAIIAAAASSTVTISGTTANGFAQVIPSLNDTVASFSSRGINDAGNVKPDVTAVGVTVFSAGNGTGNQGLNDSGTSMATPMVAGTAALVHSMHPEWNTEQVKADIMNTADQDLFTGANHTGTKFGPNRVGSGRIDVKSALDNNVLAYSIDNGPGGTDNGTVSASFGPLAIVPSSTPSTFTKTIRLQNTTLSSVTYDVSFANRTTIPGATFSVSPATVTVDPRASKPVTLTLTIHSDQLTKTIDPTVGRDQFGLPRQYQADASGNVVFTSEGDGPTLRVPAYAAPRPASAMTQASAMNLPSGDVQTGLLPLAGTRVNQGSVADGTAVQSTVAGFELQATSGMAPDCSADVTSGCVNFPDERSADLKYVGSTSDAPQLDSVGQDPLSDGFAYFSITTQGPWRTAASSQEFDIYIDSNGDGKADVVVFNTRFTGTDILVAAAINLKTGDEDDELINASFGDTDTALFNSNTLVMPVWLGGLPGLSSDASRISYVVQAFSPYQSDPVDRVGDVGNDATLTDPLSMDVLHPGVAVFGSYDGDASPLLFRDSPGSVLVMRRDAAAYAADHGMGALLIHFHNVLGDKAQLVSLNKEAASVSVGLSPNPATVGDQVTATIDVTGSVTGLTPTGSVSLDAGATHLGDADLVDGEATVAFTPSVKGSINDIVATYSGDDAYDGATSATQTLTVDGATPAVTLALSPNPVRHGKTVTAKMTVAGSVGTPTGTVALRRVTSTGTVLVGSATLSDGSATIGFVVKSKGTFSYRVHYDGDSHYATGDSNTVSLRVT